VKCTCLGNGTKTFMFHFSFIGLDGSLVSECVSVCVCVCALPEDSISHGFRCQYSMLVHPVRSFSAVSGNVPCNTVHLIKVVCLTTLFICCKLYSYF